MARHYRLEVRPPKINVISECCADAFFSEAVNTTRRALPRNHRVRLVGVGNIVRWKNWHLLISAMSRLTKAELNRLEFQHWGQAPPDPDSQRYERHIQKLVVHHNLQKNVNLRGATHSVPEVLREADWFVLPSTNEPCSVALIEAQALGLPALVSASGGNVDIVSKNRTGLLFVPESTADLTLKLRDIIDSQSEISSPAEIRESVRSRSARVVAQEYHVIYRHLVN
jgi:glycosyltransferase involved in cell wall biosynthesis